MKANRTPRHKNLSQEVLYRLGKKRLEITNPDVISILKPAEVRHKGVLPALSALAISVTLGIGAADVVSSVATAAQRTGSAIGSEATAISHGTGNYLSSHLKGSDKQTKEDLAHLAKLPSDQTVSVTATPFGIDDTFSTPGRIADHFADDSVTRHERIANLVEAEHPGKLATDETVEIPYYLIDHDLLPKQTQ